MFPEPASCENGNNATGRPSDYFYSVLLRATKIKLIARECIDRPQKTNFRHWSRILPAFLGRQLLTNPSAEPNPAPFPLQLTE